ncbi:MAG TPA: FG-GAP-like repeat-containing protein [Gemmataceae bacterium]
MIRRGSSRSPARRVSHGPLSAEALEQRSTPVVGALDFAPAAEPGTGLDGVVFLRAPDGLTCSGALLYSGRHVLTSAHCIDRDGDRLADGPVTVRFDLPGGSVEMTVGAGAVHVAPGWAGLVGGKIPPSGHDWAVLTLPEEAPEGADRYDIYRGGGEVGQTFVVVGYGTTGTGARGSDLGTVGVKRFGVNRFDSDVLNYGGDRFPPGTGLGADFDSGSPGQDAYGVTAALPDLGAGAQEAMIGPGDSGGPALLPVGGRYVIAGVASLAASSTPTDIDPQSSGQSPRTNHSFGEFFGYTRVSAFAAEIDALAGGPTGDPTGTPGPGLEPGTATPRAAAADALLALGADEGAEPRVRLVAPPRSDGLPAGSAGPGGGTLFEGLAYAPGFRGGVRVAVADVTGDGVPDLITAPGPGMSALVKVFDGATGAEVRQFTAFEATFRGGAFVTAADLDGDGHAELIVTPDRGGGPRVRVFDGATGSVRADFLGIEDPNFRGGARAATGDLNGDGVADLLLGAGFGGGPRVAVYDGAALATGEPAKLVADFFVFEPTLKNGVYLGGGDLNRDGFAEIVVAGGPGGGPRVLVLDGADLLRSGGRLLTPRADFFAGDASARSGARVAVKDVGADGAPDLVVAPGAGAGTKVRAYPGDESGSGGFELIDFPVPSGVFVG